MAEQPTPPASEESPNRRRFLKLAGTAGLATLASGVVAAPALAVIRPPMAERTLSFVNLHTGERLTAPFWSRGRYHRDGVAEIDWILRDWRTGDVVKIDRGLFDLLFDLRRRLNSDAPIHVISGYRSAETNAMLRNVSLGVAKNSYHTRGMAIDIRIPDRKLRTLHRTALDMRAGGVGYYPASNFVHVDVGPVRRW